MKTLKLVAMVMVFALSVISCAEDEDDFALVSGNKYEATYAKVAITNDSTSVKVSAEYKTAEELAENGFDNVIEFKSDGTFYDDGIEDGTWTQENTVIKVTYADGDYAIGSVTLNKVIVSFTHIDIGFTIDADVTYTKM